MKYRALVTCLLLAASGVATAADCKPQTQIDVATIKPQAILVGEVHGTEQTPAFVAGLVCSLLNAGRPVVLALERSSEEQVAIDRYIDSEGSETDRQALLSNGAWTWPMQDGRNSQAVLALIDSIRLLRRAGQSVGILAMQHFPNPSLPKASKQPNGPSGALLSRMNDRFMADMIAAVMAQHPDHTIVALAGNFHTATTAAAWAEPGHQPVGEVLAALVPIYVIGLSAKEGGNSWNCTGPNDCGARAMIGGPMYVQGNQIDAIAELGKISASAPAAPAAPASK